MTSWHFAGICGIGMSALAQFARAMQIKVSGSDRALENPENAEIFMNSVDSSAVYHNASTRFTDGGEFGFGAEIGISTQKLHARGPLGLPQLNSFKYKIYGNGQVR